MSLPCILTYNTPFNVADAVAFYQEQLPILGWQLLDDTAVTDTTALLPFAQGDQELTVFIILGEDSAEVIVLDSSSGRPVADGLPADEGEGAGTDTPLLPDAYNVEDTGGILTYQTSATPEEAAAFYEEQMPALGWGSMGSSSPGLLLYIQGAEVFSVLIENESGVTTITIIIG